jgi:hypothetical protein
VLLRWVVLLAISTSFFDFSICLTFGLMHYVVGLFIFSKP